MGEGLDARAVNALLQQASAAGTAEAITLALGTIARSGSMTQLARETGLTRATLYQALSPGGNPTLATVIKVADALGLRVALAAIAPDGLPPSG